MAVTDLPTASAAPPSALPWVAPFAVFLLWMLVWPYVSLGDMRTELLRLGVLAVVLLTVSRGIVASLRVTRWLSSLAVGLLAAGLWLLPGILWPGYREQSLFQNGITGETVSTLPDSWLASPLLLSLRVARAALLVPLVEEIFWRGFLPRWVLRNNWDAVPMGSYNTLAFVATALLFAAQHGPYWDVALLCGLIFNWYMWTTRSLGDLVLAHVATNAALAAYAVATRQYVFWM